MVLKWCREGPDKKDRVCVWGGMHKANYEPDIKRQMIIFVRKRKRYVTYGGGGGSRSIGWTVFGGATILDNRYF